MVDRKFLRRQRSLWAAGGSTFNGDATYYSDGTIGACSQNNKPSGFRTVALNSQQWDNGALCGTCIEGSYLEGYPKGSGSPCVPPIPKPHPSDPTRYDQVLCVQLT